MGLDFYFNSEDGKYHDTETGEVLEEETITVMGFEVVGVQHNGLLWPIKVPGEAEKVESFRKELARASMNPNLYSNTGHST